MEENLFTVVIRKAKIEIDKDHIRFSEMSLIQHPIEFILTSSNLQRFWMLKVNRVGGTELFWA